MKLLSSLALAALAAQVSGAAISHKLDGFTLREHADASKRELLQKYVSLATRLRLQPWWTGGLEDQQTDGHVPGR